MPCHTELLLESEVSIKSKCGYFANAQYDKKNKAQNDSEPSEPKARFVCHTERSEVSICKAHISKQQTRFIILVCKDNLIKIYAYKATLFATKTRNLKTLDDKNLA